jgi:fumarate reductase flavoprotein subunit
VAEPFYDAVIVGAGAAGLAAAVAAADRGARVCLLEGSGEVGGALRISPGPISGAGTRRQAERGIADSPAQHYADAMRASRGGADPAFLSLAVGLQGPLVDWLTDNGFEMAPEAPRVTPGRTPRAYWGPEGGRSILKVLERLLDAHVAAGRVALHLRAEVAGLIVEDAVVTGARTTDGREFRGAAVVLTTGGYAANPELFARIHGGARLWSGSDHRAKGAGLELGLEAGGVLVHADKALPNFGGVLDHTLAEPRYRAPGGLAAEVRAPWEIVVNREGRRFYAEDDGDADARAALLQRQPGSQAWVIYDEAIRQAAPSLFSAFPAEKAQAFYEAGGCIVTADSLAGLARGCGLDAAALADTVEAYNRAVETGEDPLGRRHLPRRIEAAPFHALPIVAYTVRSSAGLKVDTELRVLDAGGRPIARLYAVGEILGALLSGRGGARGMMLTPALAFGRRLGQRLPIGEGR